MLSSCTAERHHQVFEAAVLVITYAGINEGHDIRKVLVNAFVLRQVIHHESVFAREIFVALFAPGIRQAAYIKDESAAISGVILRKPLVERKTKDAYDQLLLLGRLGGDVLQFFRTQHV